MEGNKGRKERKKERRKERRKGGRKAFRQRKVGPGWLLP